MDDNIIQKYCRVCANKKSRMISIFEHHDFSQCNLQVSEVITKCASVQIRKLDGFPELICNECLEHLGEAFSFKRLCEDSDYKFQHNLVLKDCIVSKDAYCEEVTKIECFHDNDNISNEELDCTSSGDGFEIKEEFNEGETKIQYSIIGNQLDEENIITPTIDSVQNLKGELLLQSKPTILSNEKTEHCGISNKQLFQQGNVRKSSSDFNRSHNLNDSVGETTPTTIPNENSHMCKIFRRSFNETAILNNQEKECYKCKICGKYYTCKAAVIRLGIPIDIHCEDKPYQCEICKKRFIQERNLKTHVKIHSKDRPYKCEICLKNFRLKRTLKYHTSIHTGYRPYKCEICNKSFSQKGYLKIHIKIHREEKPYKCEICNKSFNQQSNLKTHVQIHSKDKPYKCEICNKNFRQKQTLKYHARIHTGCRPYKCEICNKSFKQKIHLKIHIKIHFVDKTYTCEICNKSFTQETNLKTHVKIHSKGKLYKCEICLKNFQSKRTLKNHTNIHTGYRPYKCEICNKGFNREDYLNKIHMKIHSEDKPYKCEICNKSFNQQSNLKTHVQIHSKDKPYKCEICHKNFRQKQTLKYHARIHTGCPYKCEICNKSFKQKCNLKTHVKKIHSKDKS